GGTAPGFLSALYRDELSRALDPTGAAVWGAALAGGAARSEVGLQVMTSLEGDRVLVSNAYREVLGRVPDAVGGSYWGAPLQGGAGGEAVLAGVPGSDEFFLQMSAYIGANPTDPTAVAAHFVTGANRFGESLPGLEQVNRNIATKQVVFVSTPPTVAFTGPV